MHVVRVSYYFVDEWILTSFTRYHFDANSNVTPHIISYHNVIR